MKRCVAFDMDGVIIDGMPYHEASWRQAFQEVARFDIPIQEIYLGEGVKGLDFIKYIAEKYRLPLSEVAQRALYRRKRELFDRIFEPKEMKCARSLLEEVSRMKYRLSLVTGTRREIAMKVLRDLKMDKFFEVVVSGSDVVEGKPAPEPYITALRKIGALPSFCLVVENSPSGILSAKSAGLLCIAIESSLSRSFLQEADLVFKDLCEAKGFFVKEFQLSGGRGPWILERRF